MNGVIGVVTCFAGNFAPRNWASCNGQIMSIVQNTALFSILGTTYGGNGQTTFALPDLRGRIPVSSGQGAGLADHTLGESGGSENIILNINQLPQHAHNGATTFQQSASSDDGTDSTPNSGYPARFTGAFAAAPNVAMLAPGYAATIGMTGNGQPADIRSPYLALNYIICLFGIFPSRN